MVQEAVQVTFLVDELAAQSTTQSSTEVDTILTFKKNRKRFESKVQIIIIKRRITATWIGEILRFSKWSMLLESINQLLCRS